MIFYASNAALRRKPLPSGGDTLGQDAGAAIKGGPIVYATPVDVDFTAVYGTTTTEGSRDIPPSPPAIPLETMQSEDADPDVDVDEAGSVTAAAPPPPPPRPPSIAALVPAATPAPPGPAVAAELDTRGLPWDARIHASNRAKSIKGTWKAKRGVDPNLVTAVEEQNKPGNAVTVAPAAAATVIPAATVPVSSTATSAPPPPPPPPVPPSPGVPSAAIASVAPSTGIATTPLDFRGLMQKIQKATADSKLTADQVNAALAGVGLKPEEMAQLINNAPLIAGVNAAIEGYLA